MIVKIIILKVTVPLNSADKTVTNMVHIQVGFYQFE